MSRLHTDSARTARPSKADVVKTIDTTFLQSLVGYNTRRASLHIIKVLMQHLPHDFRVVEFSVLSLLAHNPGLTSRHICAALDIMPPNLVGLIAVLKQRGLVEGRQHPSDGRAIGLYLTEAGQTLAAETEQTVEQLEIDATLHLSTSERKTLIRLLQKIYASG